MAVEDFYFKELQKVLEEIRDEMRKLREAVQTLLEVPQPIMVNVEQTADSSSWNQLQAYFDESQNKDKGTTSV
jgi:hypothetical protein